MATISLAVTVANPGSGNKYYIDGVLQATVSMTPGNTYKFDQSDSSNSGHPLRLSTTSNGTHGGGSAYTTGVTTAGTPGSSGAYTQIEVTAITVQTLYYYCTNHSGMGGSISVGNASNKNLKELSGFNVQNKSSDPVPYAQELVNNPYSGAWGAGGNMNSARFLQGGAGATHSAAITFGGRNPSLSPGPNSNFTESYNGTSWTEVGDMNQSASYWAGMGTNTAALAVGGSPPATAGYTEQWNGSAWTAKNALTRGSATPQAGTYGMGNGTTTSALFYGGDEGSSSQDRTEEWDGTNWTEVADLNTGRGYGAGMGVNAEAALCVGGLAYPTGNLTITESWNGSAWTEVGDLNTGRLLYNGASTQAPSSDGIVYSGRNVSTNASFGNTESWNGTAWTEVSDLATARRAGGGGGVATNAIMSGGSPNGSPPYSNSNATEEWTFSGLPPSTPVVAYSDAIVGEIYYNSSTGEFKAIRGGGAPLGTWASGGNLLAATSGQAGFGTQTAALSVGGYLGPPGATAKNEEYDGTSFTEKADINQARYGLKGAGTTTAGIVTGGPAPNNNLVELWNGSSWTETTEMASGKENHAAVGTSTATLVFGGVPPATGDVNTFYWNGSSWSEQADMNQAKRNLAGFGVYNSAISAGGETPSVTANTESYDGTSWTEVNNMNTARRALAGSGSFTAGLVYGGTTGSDSTATESWNGTSWTEQNDLATGRLALAGAGTSDTRGFAIGGEDPVQTGTEEFTAADFEIKTMTTS